MVKNKLKALENYLHRFKTSEQLIESPPKEDLKIVVVIPIYNEKEILPLKCLETQQINFSAEVYFVINDAENSPKQAKEQNQRIFEFLSNYKFENPKINFHTFYLKSLPKKKSGVGYARKVGFDEAIRRFLYLKNPEGILVSLDADTKCQQNYLTSIFDYYKKNPKTIGANICFYHIAEDEDLQKAVYLYEIYMRYYIEALRLSGFPYAYHTIGSAFSVKAHIYAAQGGMTIKQAGEDFYFLTKIFPLGNFGEIKNTKVFPSGRITDRVPFGTGVAVKKIIQDNFSFKTYNLNAFYDLKKFFSQIPNFHNQQNLKYNLPQSISAFLQQDNFSEKLKEIKQNSSAFETFKKRFFNYFNGFKVLKFLNFSHQYFYEKQEVIEATKQLLSIPIKQISTEDVLEILREKQC